MRPFLAIVCLLACVVGRADDDLTGVTLRTILTPGAPSSPDAAGKDETDGELWDLLWGGGGGTSSETTAAAREEENARSIASAELSGKVDAAGRAATDPKMDVTLGTNTVYPTVSLQYSIDTFYSVGVTGSYFHFLYNGVNSNLAGGLLTLNGYTQSSFRGFWGQLAGGAYSSATTFGTFKGTQLALSGLATLGYRWRWSGFNLAVAGGAQYFDLQRTTQLNLHTSLLLPVVLFDVGWAF